MIRPLRLLSVQAVLNRIRPAWPAAAVKDLPRMGSEHILPVAHIRDATAAPNSLVPD